MIIFSTYLVKKVFPEWQIRNSRAQTFEPPHQKIHPNLYGEPPHNIWRFSKPHLQKANENSPKPPLMVGGGANYDTSKVNKNFS